MSEPNGRRRLDEARRIVRQRVERASVPPDAYGRMRARADARRSRRVTFRRIAYGLLGGAAVGAVSLGLWIARPPPSMCGFVLQSDDRASCETNQVLEVASTRATLRVAELGIEVVADATTRVARAPDGLRLVAGRVRIVVAPRQNVAAVRVHVSHGVIEVMGTVFYVEQRAEGGTVRLERGRLRFVPTAGPAIELGPGEQLQWPEAASAAPPADVPTKSPPGKRRRRPAAHAPPHAAQPAPVVPAADILAELQTLRIRHEYPALIQRLTRIVATEEREPLREQLSWELCDALARHGGEPERACRCAVRHLARYPTGRYSDQLGAMRTSSGCP